MNFVGIFRNRHVTIIIFHGYTFFGNQWMISSHERHIRTKHNIIANVNASIIHHHEIKVSKEVIPDESMSSVIKLYRTLEIILFTNTSYKLFNNWQSGFVIFIHKIKLPA